LEDAVSNDLVDVGLWGGGCCLVHGCFLLVVAVASVVALACDIHAERHLAKAGVASCRGRGLPTLGEEAKPERKGRSEAEVCTSEARKIGEAPCGARSGQRPLARLVYRARRGTRMNCFWGVAGYPRRGGDGRVGRFFSPAHSAGRGRPTPP
jgi:hypothetical protein